MTSSDERNELLHDASSLAYTAIRFTGLYKELSSAEWDGLAEKLAPDIVDVVIELIDEEQERIDRAREKWMANHG